MLSDIEIAQQAELLPVKEIAEKLNIKENELEPYGHYKAKLSDELMERLQDKPDGKERYYRAERAVPRPCIRH